MYRKCRPCIAHRHGDVPSIWTRAGIGLPTRLTLAYGGALGYHVETVPCAANYRPTLFARLFGRWL